MKINAGRLQDDFSHVTSITSTELGCTRFSYSLEDKKARDYIKGNLEKIGTQISIDSVGNIRAKYNPNNLSSKSLLIGSHIDTVPKGGKYDGLTGTLCSLEVLRVLKENNIELKNPIEFVIFAEEEGSNFGVTMVGSKYMSKHLELNDLKKLFNDNNTSAYEYIQHCGFSFQSENDYFVDGENELGMIELHVEQGGVLDKKGVSLGIVMAIAGMNTLQVTVTGVSNHAGTTPMNYRKDALLAASEMIFKMSKIALDYETAVITVGKINVAPNASNVIASEVIFNVDIRDVIQENIDSISEKVEKLCSEIASKNSIGLGIKLIGSSKVVNMDESLLNVIEDQAINHNLTHMRMNSGAVHDNAMLNGIIPTAMIFVPSKDGISHSPYEETDFNDILAGAELLLHTVLQITSVL